MPPWVGKRCGSRGLRMAKDDDAKKQEKIRQMKNQLRSSQAGSVYARSKEGVTVTLKDMPWADEDQP